MKVGIVGAGKSAARARCGRGSGSARNIFIVDRTRKRAKAVATDLLYGRRFVQRHRRRRRDYDDWRMRRWS